MKTSTLVVAAFLLVAGQVHAQPGDESTRTAVRTLAAEGDALMSKGDYAGALDRFSRASSLIAAPTLRLREAVCLEKLGRWVEAADLYRLASRTQLEASASPEFREAVRQAEQGARTLEAKLPKVVIALEGKDLEGARVEVDGKEVPAAVWGTGWPVNPGTRTVVATKGVRRAEAKVEAVESSSVKVALSLPLPAPAQAPASVAPAEAPKTGMAVAAQQSPEPRQASPQRTWGWVGLGIGVAGLAAGGIAGGIAMAKRGSFPSTCDDVRCPSQAQGDVDSYNSMRTISSIGFGVGIVGVGAGLALLLTAPADREHKPQASMQPWVGPGSAGLSGVF